MEGSSAEPSGMERQREDFLAADGCGLGKWKAGQYSVAVTVHALDMGEAICGVLLLAENV